jgi:hypothetical protein
VRTLYDKSRPDLRIRVVKLLLDFVMKLVYARKADLHLNLDFGNPTAEGMPIDNCTVSMRGFEVFRFRSAEFQAIDNLFSELDAPKPKPPRAGWLARFTKKFRTSKKDR